MWNLIIHIFLRVYQDSRSTLSLWGDQLWACGAFKINNGSGFSGCHTMQRPPTRPSEEGSPKEEEPLRLLKTIGVLAACQRVKDCFALVFSICLWYGWSRARWVLMTVDALLVWSRVSETFRSSLGSPRSFWWELFISTMPASKACGDGMSWWSTGCSTFLRFDLAALPIVVPCVLLYFF